MKTVDLIVITRPSHIEYHCHHCSKVIEIDYDIFVKLYGDPYEIEPPVIECSNCGGKSAIENIFWD